MVKDEHVGCFWCPLRKGEVCFRAEDAPFNILKVTHVESIEALRERNFGSGCHKSVKIMLHMRFNKREKVVFT